VLTNTGWAQKDVKMRIEKAAAYFIKLYQVEKPRDISIAAKLRISEVT
jgi:hypothetical protein